MQAGILQFKLSSRSSSGGLFSAVEKSTKGWLAFEYKVEGVHCTYAKAKTNQKYYDPHYTIYGCPKYESRESEAICCPHSIILRTLPLMFTT